MYNRESSRTVPFAYKGQIITKKRSHDGWGSDGKYTRCEENTYTFSDDIGIHEEYKYHDDDGQSGEYSSDIKDARGVLNWCLKNINSYKLQFIQ